MKIELPAQNSHLTTKVNLVNKTSLMPTVKAINDVRNLLKFTTFERLH